MTLETFFEKFDQFADAPDAVARMRELVLLLAVQGRVVDQDSNNEPAAKLLQRLVAFKLANPLSGRSGRSKEEPVDNEPNSKGLPANWVNTTIGEVVYVIRGASPRPKGDPQYFSETQTPYHWVKISDIRKHGQNGLLMDTDEFLTEAGMRKSVLLPQGTLVLTNSATIGVPIVLGIEGCCIHDGYLAFPNFPHDLLSQKFLLYLFHTLKKHAERNARGLAQLNLNTDLVRTFPFGLPPLAEQKRIVAKVDELMALCDRLEAQQQEREKQASKLARASLARFADAPTPANLSYLFHSSFTIPPSDLRKSILTLAVQGKLVPQDEEAPIGTLESILAEASVNGVSKGPTFDKSATEILRISAGTSRGDFYVNEDDFKHVDLPPDEIEKFQLAPGDLLACRFNGNLHYVGRFSYYRGESGRVQVNPDKLIRFRIKTESHCPRYVCLAMNAAPTREAIEALCATTAGNIGLSAGRLKTVEIPLPPLAEQRRIVAKVEQLMALVDALETQLAASRATAANLLSALVAELTGAAGTGKVSVLPISSSGHRGRPRNQ